VIEARTDGIEIRTRVDVRAARLLRRHVCGRSEHRARCRELRGFSAEPKAKVVDKLKKIVTDFSRIVGGEVIDDRVHTTREINV